LLFVAPLNTAPTLAECTKASFEQQINIQLARLGICHDACRQEASGIFYVFVVVVAKATGEDFPPS
jgi:hypothetical protein